MAEFYWREAPPSGACLCCGTASAERGFVDFIGDTPLYRDGQDTEIIGIVDVFICGTCLEQAARLVGCASQPEVMDMAFQIVELTEKLTKAEDEAVAYRELHEQFVTEFVNTPPGKLPRSKAAVVQALSGKRK